ncbi:MAG: hypothetical protein EOP21_11290 [Hyphomicrobiales bacterium]|nr:MAG: hypothetical protein EOP21_11290 [Hyphomicrobiales bacterium]
MTSRQDPAAVTPFVTIGDDQMNTKPVQTVCVVGLGSMGFGIGASLLRGGFNRVARTDHGEQRECNAGGNTQSTDGVDDDHGLVPCLCGACCQRRCSCRGECSRSRHATVTGVTWENALLQVQVTSARHAKPIRPAHGKRACPRQQANGSLAQGNIEARMKKEKTTPDCDIVVIGAGFVGIYALWQARQRNLTARGFESAPDVGGTWYWNSYPGARCDVASYNYAYFFDSEIVKKWDWTDVCSYQNEIQRYLRHVAERCDVLNDITFNTKVTASSYSSDTGLWTVTADNGETVVCRYVILAIGALSEPKTPDIEGVHDFAGEAFFTSMWPKDRIVDLTGKRVGVIGTGSSGVQVIPEIAALDSSKCASRKASPG